MPHVKALVEKVGYRCGDLIGVLQFNEKAPKAGDYVSVKWGSTRTLSQNALYWKYLTWLIDHGGLKDHGHFDPQALHDNLKAHFLSEKIMDKGEFKSVEDPTTTEMGKTEFGEYFDKVDHFMLEFFNIDTTAFWDDYAERKES
jgi:hypothetical protein